MRAFKNIIGDSFHQFKSRMFESLKTVLFGGFYNRISSTNIDITHTLILSLYRV